MILEGREAWSRYLYDVLDDVFMMCFGYRPYTRGSMEALESGERVRCRNMHLVYIRRLIGEIYSRNN